MGRGTHRGFITYEELSKSLGKRNLSDDNLSQAFMHILDEGVALVEKKSDFKVLRKKESSSKEEGKTIEKSDDPIRMYLREMGGVELLSREGEIAIAKRIEAGKDVMLIALAQSPITAQQFSEWNEKLQKDEMNKSIGSKKNKVGANTKIFSSTLKQNQIYSIMLSANNINYSIQQINDAINQIVKYSLIFKKNINDINNSNYTNGYFFQAFKKDDNKTFTDDNIVDNLQDILKKTSQTAKYIEPRKNENKLANIKGITKDTMQIPEKFNAKANATCEDALKFKPEKPKGWWSGGNKRSQKKLRKRKHKATMKRK